MTTTTTNSETGKILRDLMSTELIRLDEDVPAREAAKLMREHDVGNVLVTRKGRLCGIVTDRDIVVRCIADGKDPEKTQLSEFCSEDLLTLKPDSKVGEAIRVMTEHAVRRVPVVDGDHPVGIVTLGDLAVSWDRKSALGEISSAKPNG
jgi:CBS domain-containing protein